MSTRQVTFAINQRPDSRFYFDGEAPLKGFDGIMVERPKSWTFYVDMVTDVPWDVADLAFSHYLIAKDLGKPLTAVPAFQLRFFPHSGLTVRKDAGINTPADLVGKRVGVHDWGINPAVWLRGALTHQYEVPTERITWAESAAAPSFPGLTYPRSRRYTIEQWTPRPEVAHSQRDSYGLAEALETGAVDAVALTGLGQAETERSRRLFADPAAEARRYVEQTGVFPINTVFVLKQETAERLPDLGPTVLETASVALEKYTAEIDRDGAPNHTYVPVSLAKEMGQYPFRHGLEANRAAIQMMIAYCYEQGLIKTLYRPEDLFVASCR
jgi:4,5-dihydroxyphthalate decarboxylase